MMIMAFLKTALQNKLCLLPCRLHFFRFLLKSYVCTHACVLVLVSRYYLIGFQQLRSLFYFFFRPRVYWPSGMIWAITSIFEVNRVKREHLCCASSWQLNGYRDGDICHSCQEQQRRQAAWDLVKIVLLCSFARDLALANPKVIAFAYGRY